MPTGSNTLARIRLHRAHQWVAPMPNGVVSHLLSSRSKG